MERTGSMAQGVPGATLHLPAPSPRAGGATAGSCWGCKENKSGKVGVPVLGGVLPRSGHACKRQRWGSSRGSAGTGEKGAQPLLPPRAPSWASRWIDTLLRLPRLGQGFSEGTRDAGANAQAK